jgi:hypothetical protein
MSAQRAKPPPEKRVEKNKKIKLINKYKKMHKIVGLDFWKKFAADR